MTNRTTGLTLAIALLSSSAMISGALAADLPSRRAPPVFTPPPLPVFTWTGFYVGLQAGYEFGRSTAFATSNLTGAGLVSTSGSPDGLIGGVHGGYLLSTQSFQTLPIFGQVFGSALGAGGVFGIEADVNGANFERNYAVGGFTDGTRDNIEGSVRGRLGIAVDRALFYATGGVAVGGLHNTYTNNVTGGVDSLGRTRVGYTVGGGVEYAVTNNVSLRAEYRFTEFSAFTNTLVASSLGGVTIRQRETDNRVQVGFSYKLDVTAFGTPAAPVVARY